MNQLYDNDNNINDITFEGRLIVENYINVAHIYEFSEIDGNDTIYHLFVFVRNMNELKKHYYTRYDEPSEYYEENYNEHIEDMLQREISRREPYYEEDNNL